MKKLELNQMENLEGSVSCGGGAGAALGLTVGLLAATVVTGGAAIFVGAYFIGGIGSSLLAMGNCDPSIWN